MLPHNTLETNRSAETLYANHGAIMYGICLKLAGNENVAHEIFQKAFLEITRKSLTGEMADAFTSSQLCIVKHTCKVALQYLNAGDLKSITKKIFSAG
ncbi:MAG: hypothetical protein V4722_11880 [Bacteroidota bacterium]